MAKIRPSKLPTSPAPIAPPERSTFGKVAGRSDGSRNGVSTPWGRGKVADAVQPPLRALGAKTMKSALSEASKVQRKNGLPKALRLVNLVQLLLRHTEGVEFSEIMLVEGYRRSQGPATRANEKQLKKELATSRKAFERDATSLAQMGIVIETSPMERDPSRKLYRLSTTSALARPLNLGPLDCVVVQSMLKHFAEHMQSEFGSLVMNAAIKLLVGQDAANWIGHAGARHTRKALMARRSEEDRATRCYASLSKRQRVTFSYKGSGRARPSERQVEVYGLGHRPRGTYVVGRDMVADEVRIFKLSRIQGSIKGVGHAHAYEVPTDFDLDQHVPPGIFAGQGCGAYKDCEIWFSADVGFIIQNEFEGVHEVNESDDGSVTLRINEVYASELFRFLCDFAGHFRVVKPKALRDDLAAKSQEALARYSGFRGRKL